ncbi:MULTISPECIES: sensor domain-containing protein [unclassified Mycobacterium]|uniref:sensor domain-containing protein n=1 Tax=unclassified Mycobacterium TaxID=2642494 RepID=UPI0007FC5584|nr:MULTISPECIES: sensor domain-containing protein [unclassified Mycobacterium]OBG71901.1 hypothetical protein A5700_10855 [Mycobacterium sp. E1214]OBH30326.1 hypothetical protein A5693_18285 [Mycobacterium sp. E1319]
MSNPFGGNPFNAGPFPPPQQAAAPPAPPRDEVNVLATLSVIFAFVFAPAGALFGHLGLVQIRRTGERGRDRALIGTTLSYVFITVAVVALIGEATLPRTTQTTAPTSTTTSTAATRTTATTTTTTAPPPTVAPADLDGLLPSVEDVENTTGDRTMTTRRTLHQPTADDPRGQLERPECWPVEESSAPEGYDGSGFTGFSAREIVDSHDVYHQWNTGAGVAAYRDATAAQAQLAKLQSAFRQCGGSTIKATWPNGKTWPMTITSPADAGNGISTVQLLAQTTVPISCTHAVAAKLNVVVDVLTCSTTPTAAESQQATVSLTNSILGKMPA